MLPLPKRKITFSFSISRDATRISAFCGRRHLCCYSSGHVTCDVAPPCNLQSIASTQAIYGRHGITNALQYSVMSKHFDKFIT